MRDLCIRDNDCYSVRAAGLSHQLVHARPGGISPWQLGCPGTPWGCSAAVISLQPCCRVHERRVDVKVGGEGTFVMSEVASGRRRPRLDLKILAVGRKLA